METLLNFKVEVTSRPGSKFEAQQQPPHAESAHGFPDQKLNVDPPPHHRKLISSDEDLVVQFGSRPAREGTAGVEGKRKTRRVQHVHVRPSLHSLARPVGRRCCDQCKDRSIRRLLCLCHLLGVCARRPGCAALLTVFVQSDPPRMRGGSRFLGHVSDLRSRWDHGGGDTPAARLARLAAHQH